MAGEERSGRLVSGDVSIFYRAFGTRGRTPILLMHGSNYFDSYDWIEVGKALATDRETASYDKRGFGESTWSASKDYSLDAQMGDVAAVIGKLGWDKPMIAGHSSSGRLSIAFAANFPDKVSRLAVIDSGLTRDAGGPRATTGNPPLVFESVDAAMAHFAKLSNPPRIASDRTRAENALVRVENGYMLKRDPDFQNAKPQGEGAALPQRASRDIWSMLTALKCPTLIVHGTRSDRWPPEMIARVQRDYPHFAWAAADAQHDVAYQARDQLVAALRKFAGTA
jgi:pimeloyl-ACP methyl ester carboxylesterase